MHHYMCLIRAPLYGILAVNNLADLVITDQPTKHLSADYFLPVLIICYMSTQSTSVITAKQLWVQSFYCKTFLLYGCGYLGPGALDSVLS